MVNVDLTHGGRWTSLQLGGREWLWSRDDPARASVRPGDPFVDAGGVEECVPTVRGTPDHGAAWSRPWQRKDGVDAVDCGAFVLERRLHAVGGVRADYRLSASPGFRFVWAAHALLDLSPDARVILPAGTPMRLYLDDGPAVCAEWPEAGGMRLDRLGPDDGTAVGAVVVGCRDVTVVDRDDRLNARLTIDEAPTAIALWRNLAGWPPGDPYRSIGVEPMIGAVFDLAEAGPGDAATVPASGFLEWRLEITA